MKRDALSIAAATCQACALVYGLLGIASGPQSIVVQNMCEANIGNLQQSEKGKRCGVAYTVHA
jgi:hypothetical protein